MLDGLITTSPPPSKRIRGCEGEFERHFSEGAVMIAFGMHLLRVVPGLTSVEIHPDGEHGKRFKFRDWLNGNGFEHSPSGGKTDYAGTYRNAAGQSIVVEVTSGVGDVIAEIAGRRFVAECKGGVINTKHPGQTSRLKKGLCEAVGLSLCAQADSGTRHFAVAPRTSVTEKWAKRMAARASSASVEIALVDEAGGVFAVDGATASKNEGRLAPPTLAG
jgi:hypothetical protein